MPRVLILGGGTGGTLLANLLARSIGSQATITVVNSQVQHYYQPGWLYVPFGQQDPRSLTAHFQAAPIAEQIAAAVGHRAPDTKKSAYEGHAMCFLEVGHSKATILDFDYSGPPKPKDPNALMHYLKMGFNKAYFHIVPSGWM